MRRRIALAAALITLGVAPAAAAQGPSVQAIEGARPEDFRWSPEEVTIKAGETVTWRFDGASAPHNVAARGGNWQFSTTPAVAQPPVSYVFNAPGVYAFVCSVHDPQMDGRVIVTDQAGTPPPPPPPPPLSEQHWVNDQQPPTVFELADEVRPRLSRVRMTSVRNGARVRFRLSERARVTVRFKLAGLTVKTARRSFRKGAGSVTVRDPRMHGRYRIEVLARDLAGNRSRVRRARLMIR